MSICLIYHAFGIKAKHEYIRQEFTNSIIHFMVKHPLYVPG